MSKQGARIYIRRNGRFGATCDGTKDTGHDIYEDSGRFTVRDHDGNILCQDATREEAEAAIAKDWQNP